MCDRFGELCIFCKRGDEHPPESRTGMTVAEHWRKHRSIGLAVGRKQVKQMEAHYARHGLNVTHRKTQFGDYEPVITRPEQFERMLHSRGMVNQWGAE